ncbi:serine/threonine-protein kinase [Colwellia psychrerythraea]|uniref:Serine/threonine protein kinase n=1 Tax=Colwellia psychrerythraea TaxID=28229 RepID=A0A099K8C6_COLPS|nr:serine/threonine-protein kinase [Colwellia psychrerythraea]KGJ86535.1 serine/threonine protein kinase [Colwellia psychrerythraea]
MSNDNSRTTACPQCFFDNALSNTSCQVCNWSLLDDVDLDKTCTVENHSVQEQKTKQNQQNQQNQQSKSAIIDGSVFRYVDDSSINSSEMDITQAPYSSSSSTKSSITAKHGFSLTGELAHFEVHEILGQGGMGAVYRAKDKTLQRNVALKMLKNTVGTNQATKLMLLDEARMACKLNHPNIVTIFDVARTDDSNFIIMEWIDGQSLDQVIPPQGFDLATALTYASEIIAGISCAHQSNIMHSDIKPQNIMLTVDGSIKVLDFGIAGLICHQKTVLAADKNKQQDKAMITEGFTGTPGYVSPEQALSLPLDLRSDIFSFGTLLYQLLTGKRAFVGKNGKERNQAIINGDYKALPTEIPEDVRAIVNHCLSHAAADRYQSAEQVKGDLQRYITGEPVSVITKRRYWLKKKTIKHKWPVMLLLLLSVAGISQLVWQQVQTHQQQVREQLLSRFITQVETLEAKVKMSKMAPRHDTSAETAQWRQQIDILTEQISTLGAAAYGPGHYAIGRMYYALQQYDLALTHLQQAWRSGFRQTRVAYTLALSHSAIYQRQKTIISNLSSSSARKDRLAMLAQQHKQPAIEYLEQGMEGSPYQSYAKALLQFYQGQPQQALTTLDSSEDLPVWFYQHHLLRGDIYLARAEAAGAINENDKVIDNGQLALQHYGNAAEIGRSDLQLQLKPLGVHFQQLTNALYGKQQDFASLYQQAMTLVNNAMLIAPKHYQPYFIKGQLLSIKSNYQDQHSGQPINTQQQAIEQLQLALNYSAENPNILFSLARAYFHKIRLLQDRDYPVTDEFAQAINTFERILKTKRDYFFFNSYAGLLQMLAIDKGKQLQAYRVKSAAKNSEKIQELAISRYFEQAIKLYQQASQLQPNRIGAKVNLATTYLYWSQFLPLLQAQQKLLQAIIQYQQALTLNRQHFVVIYYLGQSYRWLAKINNSLLIDNSAELKQAEHYLTQAEQVRKNHAFILVEQALLAADRAIYQWQQGQPFQSLIKQAKDKLTQALLTNADNRLLIDNSALLHRMQEQLSYFGTGLKIVNIDNYQQALIEAKKNVSYGQEGYFLLQLLNHNWHDITKAEIEALPINNAAQLAQAEWYSQSGQYRLADQYFNTLQQYYPSLLWLYRRQHLQRWLNVVQLQLGQQQLSLSLVEKNNLNLQIEKLTQQIQQLNDKLTRYYPALVTAR